MGDRTSLCDGLGGHAKGKTAKSLLGKKNQVLFTLEGAPQPRAALGWAPSGTSPHSEYATCGTLTKAGRVASIYGALGFCPPPVISGKPDGLLSLRRQGVQSHSPGTGPASSTHARISTVSSLGPQEPDVVRSEGTQGSPLLRVLCKCRPLTHRSLLFQNLVSARPHEEEDDQNWDTARDLEVTAEDSGAGSGAEWGNAASDLPAALTWPREESRSVFLGKAERGAAPQEEQLSSTPRRCAPPSWKGFASR